MSKNWPELVLNNFEKASTNYNKCAVIQKTFASKLAKECSKKSIPAGIWADLGAGTGLLAEALEEFNPNQSVLRIDGSPGMLANRFQKGTSQVWDLNQGLPPMSEAPTLLASNFALHWLNNPTERIQEWFSALAPKGWLAIAVPIQGSFPEWQDAAKEAGVTCTALPLPSQTSIFKVLNPSKIKYQEVHVFCQQEEKVISLLKPIINAGANASPKQNLNVGQMRSLFKAWPRSPKGIGVNLTWLVQLLLVHK